jgi:methylase of polypeptide subunit release factors
VALLGGSDGLQCYQSIATALQQKPATLKNGGILLCEIGAGLQDKVSRSSVLIV